MEKAALDGGLVCFVAGKVGLALIQVGAQA